MKKCSSKVSLTSVTNKTKRHINKQKIKTNVKLLRSKQTIPLEPTLKKLN